MMNKAEIENQIRTLTETMYETGYTRGLKERKEDDQDYKDGLEDGRMEAWETAKKIMLPSTDGGISAYDLDNMFKYSGNEFNILINYSASDAIKKIKKYEEKLIPNIYDEVIIRSKGSFYENDKAIVLDIDNDDITVLLPDRKTRVFKVDVLERTDKSFSTLPELFEYLKGDK